MSIVDASIIFSPEITLLSIVVMGVGFLLILWKNRIAGLIGVLVYSVVLYIFYLITYTDLILIVILVVFLLFYEIGGKEIIRPFLLYLIYKGKYFGAYTRYIIRSIFKHR